MSSVDEIVNIQDAQLFQQDFDEKHFEISQEFEKLRHILLHLVKTTGKMAAWCEAKEHGKVEPDPSPLIDDFSVQMELRKMSNVDLGKKYAERIQFIINRSGKSKN